MKAAVIEEPGLVRYMDVPEPTPGPNEVRIEVLGCGLCASSLPLWEGRSWFDYPHPSGAPGHEGWGIVDMVGEQVSSTSCGDLVAFLSNNAYAEKDIAPADGIVQLPPRLHGQAVPGEAFGCALNIFERCQIQAGQLVAIIGAGFLGQALTELCAKSGAVVVAISSRRSSLEAALAHGATATFSFQDPNITEKLGAFTKGKQFGCVVEAIGVQAALDLAGEIVGTRGRLVIAGYHQDGLRTVNMQLWNWKGIDVVNAHERDRANYVRGMRLALDAIESDTLRIDSLVTHYFTLDELDQGFELLRLRPEGFVKGVVLT